MSQRFPLCGNYLSSLNEGALERSHEFSGQVSKRFSADNNHAHQMPTSTRLNLCNGDPKVPALWDCADTAGGVAWESEQTNQARICFKQLVHSTGIVLEC